METNIRLVPQREQLGGDSWMPQVDIHNTAGKMLNALARKRISNDVGPKVASFLTDVYSDSRGGS